MKRRIWAALVAALTLCVVLVGCGGGGSNGSAGADAKNLIGVWELDSMVSDGETTSSDDLALMRSLGLNVFLVVNEDGTATLNLYGEEIDGTWTATANDAATLTFDDADADEGLGNEAKMTYADNKLTVSSDSDEDTSMVFAKTTKESMDEFLSSDGGLLGSDDEDASSEAEPLDVTVADDDVLNFVLVDKEDDYSGDPNVNFTITNKTDKELYISGASDSWTVNGTAVDPVISTTVGAGETMDDFMYFQSSEVDGIENLTDVKGTFEVTDEDGNVVATYEVSF